MIADSAEKNPEFTEYLDGYTYTSRGENFLSLISNTFKE